MQSDGDEPAPTSMVVAGGSNSVPYNSSNKLPEICADAAQAPTSFRALLPADVCVYEHAEMTSICVDETQMMAMMLVMMLILVLFVVLCRLFHGEPDYASADVVHDDAHFKDGAGDDVGDTD